MADTGGENSEGTGDGPAPGRREADLHPRSLLGPDSFEYFDGERRQAPNGYFLESIRGLFRPELAQVIQTAMALTPMLLQSQIKSEHLDEGSFAHPLLRPQRISAAFACLPRLLEFHSLLDFKLNEPYIFVIVEVINP